MALLSVPLGVPMVVLGPASAVIAYTLGALVPELLGRRVLIGLLLVMAVVVVANDGDGGSVVSNAIVLGISWWLGRRSRAAAEQVQAERAATATVAERAVVEERLRIARELHDVVAHRHRDCGRRTTPRLVCSVCDEPLHPEDVIAEPGPGASDPDMLPPPVAAGS